jgi:hypothetical protein
LLIKNSDAFTLIKTDKKLYFAVVTDGDVSVEGKWSSETILARETVQSVEQEPEQIVSALGKQS